MDYSDALFPDLFDAELQKAFRAYYSELGVQVTNWEGLFAEIGESSDRILVRRKRQGGIIGFLLLSACTEVTAWNGFFTTRIGCIEEFWIAPEFRRQGHGTDLLRQAEECLIREGASYAILTTDSAPEFYCRNGYRLQRGIRAKNNADVYMKTLI